jgi:hypothetical protein
LTALILLALRGKKEQDLRLVRYAAASFFIGENACTVNYLFSSGANPYLDLVHGLGMVGMNAFLAWGLVVLLDERVIHYSEPNRPCALRRFCSSCWKREEVSCGLHRMALFVAPALAFVSLIPLTMPLRPFGVVMPVLLSEVVWIKGFWTLFAEFRVYPLLAILLFAVASLRLLEGKHGVSRAQAPFFVGLGFASFALFRLALLLTFRENPAWADWWEESTELVITAALMFSLFVFRDQLELRLPWPLAETKPASVP